MDVVRAAGASRGGELFVGSSFTLRAPLAGADTRGHMGLSPLPGGRHLLICVEAKLAPTPFHCSSVFFKRGAERKSSSPLSTGRNLWGDWRGAAG